MDHGDAAFQRIDVTADIQRLAAKARLAAVEDIDAGNDLHQCRLAGAVLAHQGVNAAGRRAKLHIVQRRHTGKFLPHALHLKQMGGRFSLMPHGDPPLSSPASPPAPSRMPQHTGSMAIL